MLQDMIQTPEQLSIHDCISSPLSDQILDFKYDEDLFEEAISPSKISSPPTNAGIINPIVTTPATTPTITSTNIDETAALSCYDHTFASAFSPFDSSDILSAILDSQHPPDPEPDILPSSAIGTPPLAMLPMTQAYPSNTTSQLDQMIATANGFASYPCDSMVSQLPLELSGYCSYLDAGDFYTDGMGVRACRGDDEMGLFATGRRVMGPPEVRSGMEACGITIYAPGSMHRVYSTGDLQILGDGQHLVGRCGGSNSTSLQRASDMSVLDDSTYKVGRLSVEERKEKIHRYLKKRNERNFSKKIKYACRKTLADSRPRVRGRFAKNDEFGESTPRPNCAHHEYDDEEEIMVKHEEDILESSDILAHISGLNSFKYNYPVESWI